MNAIEIAFVALFVDNGDRFGIRQKNADDGNIALDVRTEIMEWVGVATFDHGISFERQRGHAVTPSERVRMRNVPASGTRNQSGRCASSYSIS